MFVCFFDQIVLEKEALRVNFSEIFFKLKDVKRANVNLVFAQFKFHLTFKNLQTSSQKTT